MALQAVDHMGISFQPCLQYPWLVLVVDVCMPTITPRCYVFMGHPVGGGGRQERGVSRARGHERDACTIKCV